MIDVNPCSAQPKEYSGTAGEWTEHRQFLPSIEFCAAKVFYIYLFFGLLYATVFPYQVLGFVMRQPGCPLDTVQEYFHSGFAQFYDLVLPYLLILFSQANHMQMQDLRLLVMPKNLSDVKDQVRVWGRGYNMMHWSPLIIYD